MPKISYRLVEFLKHSKQKIHRMFYHQKSAFHCDVSELIESHITLIKPNLKQSDNKKTREREEKEEEKKPTEFYSF